MLSQRLKEDVSSLIHERDVAAMALETTRQQLLTTASSMDQLRTEYEVLITRHDALQAKMEQLVSLSASVVSRH